MQKLFFQFFKVLFLNNMKGLISLIYKSVFFDTFQGKTSTALRTTSTTRHGSSSDFSAFAATPTGSIDAPSDDVPRSSATSSRSSPGSSSDAPRSSSGSSAAENGHEDAPGAAPTRQTAGAAPKSRRAPWYASRNTQCVVGRASTYQSYRAWQTR